MASITFRKATTYGTEPYAVLTVTQGTQSVENNTTVLNWSLVLYRPMNVTSSASKSYSVNIDGTTKSGTYTIGGSGTKTIDSGSVTVTHNSDGTKSISFSGSVQFGVTWSGTSIGTISNSDSMPLDTIPRASNPTLSASSVEFGKGITITTNRASSSFTHKLYYSIGNGWVSIATGIGTSYSWTVLTTLMTSIPNATSRTITLLLETYNGSTYIGGKQISFTATVPASIKPTVSFTLDDAEGYLDIYNGYIQSKSKLVVAITAAGASGSTIKSYKTTFDGKTYTSASFETEIIKNSGTLTVSVTVTDSRGRTATATKTITVIAYSAAKITDLTAKRCNADGSFNPSGEYIKVMFSSEVVGLSNQNTADYTLKYKKSSETAFTEEALTFYEGNYAVTDGSYIFAAVISSSYNVKIEVSDNFDSIQKTALISTASVLWSMFGGGLGWAFGKVAELANTLEVALDSIFYNIATFKEAVTFENFIHIVQNGVTSRIGSSNAYYLHHYTDAPNGHWFENKLTVENTLVIGGNEIIDFPISRTTSGNTVYTKYASGRCDIEVKGYVTISSSGYFVLEFGSGWLTTVSENNLKAPIVLIQNIYVGPFNYLDIKMTPEFASTTRLLVYVRRTGASSPTVVTGSMPISMLIKGWWK